MTTLLPAHQLNLSNQVVQEVFDSSGEEQSHVPASVVLDDSVPQISEMGEVFSLVITPKNVSNLIVIEGLLYLSSTSTGHTAVGAVFKNGAVNAIVVGWGFISTGNATETVTFRERFVAGTLSPITYSVRIGGNVGNTLMNGNTLGARKFGGVLTSSVRITEITPS